jgi:hypothetical protein
MNIPCFVIISVVSLEGVHLGSGPSADCVLAVGLRPDESVGSDASRDTGMDQAARI